MAINAFEFIMSRHAGSEMLDYTAMTTILELLSGSQFLQTLQMLWLGIQSLVCDNGVQCEGEVGSKTAEEALCCAPYALVLLC